jgi:hypothetical protein
MAIVTRNTVKKFLQITVSTYDDLIDSFIIMVEADYEKIRGVDFDVDSSDVIQYPEGAELIASQMVGYLLNSTPLANQSDKKSESIGTYSYTRDDKMLEGYPKSIVGRIVRYFDPK